MDESLPDISPLRAQLMSLARRLQRETHSDDRSWARTLLLGAIDRLGGDATPSVLAVAEDMQSSNLAAALRDLESRGLIQRTADAADGRKVRVALTEAGRSLLYDGRARRERWLAEAMQASLTAEERRRLIEAAALMQRLVAYKGSAA